MIANSEVKLEKPEQYFGAVYGRGTQKRAWFYIAYVCAVTFYVIAFLLSLAVTSPKGILFTLSFALAIVFIIAPIFVDVIMSTYYPSNFEKEMQKGRTTYAHTEFKTWVEQRYGAQLTEDQALSLMNGKPTEITINDEEKIVYFQDNTESSKLFNTGTPNYIRMKDIKEWEYEINENDLKLVINNKEKPSTFTTPPCEPRYE